MKTDVIITIDKQYLHKLNDVADKLHKKNNLQVNDVKEYGLIIGTSDVKDLDSLRHHREVMSVDRDDYVQLAPPDSDVQ